MFQIDANAWHRPCPNHIDCILSDTERLKMNGRRKMERTARSLLATALADHRSFALQQREMDATVASEQSSTPLAQGPTAFMADRGQVCGSEVAAAQRKLAFATEVGVFAVLAVIWWAATQSDLPSLFVDHAGLRALVERLGMLGPVAIIVLPVAAIVFSPIPSGPLAMAAEAAYGPVLGTLYVVIGATAGASLAFMIARRFGHDAVRRHPMGRLAILTRDRPQSVLMTIVFVSRLVPFLSFDAVSYAAGLTALTFLRFLLATLFGVISVAILLTGFGIQLAALDSQAALLLAALLGSITIIPLALGIVWKRFVTGKRVQEQRPAPPVL